MEEDMSRFIPGFFGLLALIACLAAFFPVLEAFFSKRIAKTRRMVETLPARAFWIGLVNIVFALIVLFALASLGDRLPGPGGKIFFLLALIILIPLAIGLMLGLASVVKAVGERLLPEKSALAQTIWASVALTLACALPFVGWFILLPYICFLGMGAFVLGLFTKQPIEPLPEEIP
jgi:hypothetical protein